MLPLYGSVISTVVFISLSCDDAHLRGLKRSGIRWATVNSKQTSFYVRYCFVFYLILKNMRL